MMTFLQEAKQKPYNINNINGRHYQIEFFEYYRK